MIDMGIASNAANMKQRIAKVMSDTLETEVKEVGRNYYVTITNVHKCSQLIYDIFQQELDKHG